MLQVNGCCGILSSVVYEEGCLPPSPPAFLNIHFPSYRGSTPKNSDSVPIFPVDPIFGRSDLVKTFPVSLSSAITYYKSQALTLDMMAIECRGLWGYRYQYAFTGFSRVRRLEDLILMHELDLEDFIPRPGDRALGMRLEEEQRLRSIAM